MTLLTNILLLCFFLNFIQHFNLCKRCLDCNCSASLQLCVTHGRNLHSFQSISTRFRNECKSWLFLNKTLMPNLGAIVQRSKTRMPFYSEIIRNSMENGRELEHKILQWLSQYEWKRFQSQSIGPISLKTNRINPEKNS